jgi:methionyl-tRNA formyltransferase
VKDWEPYVKYGFNFHPSPLPEGRGPYPLYDVLLGNLPAWGVTAHKLAPSFDTGDMIDQELFAVDPYERHETLLSKCQMAMGQIATRLVDNLSQSWETAKPQGEGSYWPRIEDDRRSFDWDLSVEDNMRIMRAFGFVEVIARLGTSRVYVREAMGWTEPHDHPTGTIVHHYRRNYVIAVKDGYMQLTQWSPIAMNDMRNLGR